MCGAKVYKGYQCTLFITWSLIFQVMFFLHLEDTKYQTSFNNICHLLWNLCLSVYLKLLVLKYKLLNTVLYLCRYISAALKTSENTRFVSINWAWKLLTEDMLIPSLFVKQVILSSLCLQYLVCNHVNTIRGVLPYKHK